jgi:hypothetical protein
MDETPYINKSEVPTDEAAEPRVVLADTPRKNADGSSADIIDGSAAVQKSELEKESGEKDENLPGPIHSAFGDGYLGEVNVMLPKEAPKADTEDLPPAA